MKVYEVVVGHTEDTGKVVVRRIRGMAENAIEATEKVRPMMSRDERMHSARPLFSLEFGVPGGGGA